MRFKPDARMKLYRSEEEVAKASPRCLSIGVFDGVHVGHQALVSELLTVAKQRGLQALLITFANHPWTVLRPAQVPPLLTTLQERLQLLEELGIAECLLLPFTQELSLWSAERFCLEMMVERLNCVCLVVGEDFALGHKREGKVPKLKELGKELGFDVIVAHPRTVEGRVVSSSWIRGVIGEGKMELAAQLLGRPYCLGGRIMKGKGLGRQLGFPTVNLMPPPEKLLPRWGVYAGFAKVAEQRYPMVANIGVRPTVDGTQLTVEAHLLDFEGVIETDEAELELMHFLREEQKFAGLENLARQIGEDVRQAREWLRQKSLV